MIYIDKNSCLLYCFLLAFFYLNASTIAQLNAESFVYRTIYVKSNLTHNEIGQQTNQSNSTIIPDIERGSSPIGCPDEIQVDESSAGYKKEKVDCVQDLINTCKISNVYLLYATGSMSLRTTGLTNGSCQIDLIHEIERDSNSFTCAIPVSRLSSWESWKNGDGLDAVRDVMNVCSQK